FLPDLCGVFFGLHGADRSPILSNKPLRFLQNSYINTESRLHTGGLYLFVRSTLEPSKASKSNVLHSEKKG
ncbi:hypothetical protein WMY93_033394, partial [Mugilogobius chulae]